MKRKRIPRPARCPTLVAMMLAPEAEIAEITALDALAGGWALERHFNILSECRDMLAIGAENRNDGNAQAMAELGLVALQNIRDRYFAKQRVGASGEELQALRAMVDFSRDFWKRQGGETYRVAYQQLTDARNEERKAA